MIYLLAIAVIVALVWLGRRGPKKPNEWRSAAGIIGIACVVAGVATAIRGLWLAGGLIVAVGLSLTLAARRLPPSFGPMTEAQARRVLGVGEDATVEEIQSAFRSQMRKAHPDRGGEAAEAARLNAARDRLLKAPRNR